MSGFRFDVISILRENVMLHGEALGYIVLGDEEENAHELFLDLQERKFPVASRITKPVVLFDYIVIPKEIVCVPMLMSAFASLSRLGLLIIEVSDEKDMYYKSYSSVFGDFTVTKVVFDDRAYLVVHAGADYGN